MHTTPTLLLFIVTLQIFLPTDASRIYMKDHRTRRAIHEVHKNKKQVAKVDKGEHIGSRAMWYRDKVKGKKIIVNLTNHRSSPEQRPVPLPAGRVPAAPFVQ